ncbi:Aste57867_15844 [Aphanomyces stellatus]|uniref:Aste57867_15844 protein n=1 Tax=Aphanomyces stellatus TaxID=120398 RepID=A0A485L4M5_9STRA|nr:hypothetical protein As57867_015788 [Aphanomyces stellatus]VFT92631.1 Aste57867_15844 [Aphanomyces stellatus]
MDPTPCLFNDCTAPGHFAGKCDRHKGKVQCQIAECFNQVYARRLCVRHGGKLQCQAPGCMANARAHGFCCKHGAKSIKKYCQEPGCDRKARFQHRCANHGRKKNLASAPPAELEIDWVSEIMNWIDCSIDETPMETIQVETPANTFWPHDLSVRDTDLVFLDFMVSV